MTEIPQSLGEALSLSRDRINYLWQIFFESLLDADWRSLHQRRDFGYTKATVGKRINFIEEYPGYVAKDWMAFIGLPVTVQPTKHHREKVDYRRRSLTGSALGDLVAGTISAAAEQGVFDPPPPVERKGKTPKARRQIRTWAAITPARVSMWEKGKQIPQIRFRQALAGVYRLPETYLERFVKPGSEEVLTKAPDATLQASAAGILIWSGRDDTVVYLHGSPSRRFQGLTPEDRFKNAITWAEEWVAGKIVKGGKVPEALSGRRGQLNIWVASGKDAPKIHQLGKPARLPVAPVAAEPVVPRQGYADSAYLTLRGMFVSAKHKGDVVAQTQITQLGQAAKVRMLSPTELNLYHQLLLRYPPPEAITVAEPPRARKPVLRPTTPIGKARIAELRYRLKRLTGKVPAPGELDDIPSDELRAIEAELDAEEGAALKPPKKTARLSRLLPRFLPGVEQEQRKADRASVLREEMRSPVRPAGPGSMGPAKPPPPPKAKAKAKPPAKKEKQQSKRERSEDEGLGSGMFTRRTLMVDDD